jgi:hypothetical protein
MRLSKKCNHPQFHCILLLIKNQPWPPRRGHAPAPPLTDMLAPPIYPPPPSKCVSPPTPRIASPAMPTICSHPPPPSPPPLYPSHACFHALALVPPPPGSRARCLAVTAAAPSTTSPSFLHRPAHTNPIRSDAIAGLRCKEIVALAVRASSALSSWHYCAWAKTRGATAAAVSPDPTSFLKAWSQPFLTSARDRVGWFSGRLVRLVARAFYDDHHGCQPPHDADARHAAQLLDIRGEPRPY